VLIAAVLLARSPEQQHALIFVEAGEGSQCGTHALLKL
jgi:hypothetical protein